MGNEMKRTTCVLMFWCGRSQWTKPLFFHCPKSVAGMKMTKHRTAIAATAAWGSNNLLNRRSNSRQFSKRPGSSYCLQLSPFRRLSLAGDALLFQGLNEPGRWTGRKAAKLGGTALVAEPGENLQGLLAVNTKPFDHSKNINRSAWMDPIAKSIFCMFHPKSELWTIEPWGQEAEEMKRLLINYVPITTMAGQGTCRQSRQELVCRVCYTHNMNTCPMCASFAGLQAEQHQLWQLWEMSDKKLGVVTVKHIGRKMISRNEPGRSSHG